VIASCPTCGTHYKHEVRRALVRARCGRCDATFDLSALRPYRVVPVRPVRPEDLARATAHLPIGLDDPSLAVRIVAGLDAPQPAPVGAALTWRTEAPVDADGWDEAEPLPSIPEMNTAPAFEPSVPPVTEADVAEDFGPAVSPDADPSDAPGEGGAITTIGLWAMGGAVLGTGVSWTLGGTTTTGVLAGAVVGLALAWGWLRWTSKP
jgi:hypothetical protein